MTHREAIDKAKSVFESPMGSAWFSPRVGGNRYFAGLRIPGDALRNDFHLDVRGEGDSYEAAFDDAALSLRTFGDVGSVEAELVDVPRQI